MKVKDKIIEILNTADKIEKDLDEVLKQIPRTHINNQNSTISLKLSILKQALNVEKVLNQEYEK
jgi:hypothetical protein